MAMVMMVIHLLLIWKYCAEEVHRWRLRIQLRWMVRWQKGGGGGGKGGGEEV